MKKSIIVTVILAIVAFTSIGMWGDIFKAGPYLRMIPWYMLPLIAFFGFSNDMIKFFRWHIYLKKMDINISIKDSLIIFVSGLSMSATPGKLGFLIKSQMLKSLSGRTIISTSPIIIAELYMDLIALSLISLLGVTLLGAKWIWLAALLCVVPLVGLIPQVADFAFNLIARIPALKGRAVEMKKALDDMFALFGEGVIIMAFIITLIAWTSEGVALHLILKCMGYDMSIITATIIFGFSTLIGVLTMLPGGLIVTDASLMGLIVKSGVASGPAAVASIMSRLFTLWLAIIIGSIVLLINKKFIFSRIKEDY